MRQTSIHPSSSQKLVPCRATGLPRKPIASPTPELPTVTVEAAVPALAGLRFESTACRSGDFTAPRTMHPALAQPLMYPASNHPAMWQLLGPLIEQSPLLKGQLDALARAGWRIDWSPTNTNQCRTWAKTIRLTIDWPLISVQALAHEARHAFQGTIFPRRFPSDLDFGKFVVGLEAEAVLNQLQVRQEILTHSGIDIGIFLDDPGYYETAMAFYARHGDKDRLLGHIRMHYGWQAAASTRTTYWEDAMNDWRLKAGLAPFSLPPSMKIQGYTAANQYLAFDMWTHDMQRGHEAKIAQAARTALHKPSALPPRPERNSATSSSASHSTTSS
ncbi:hypothetical protein [Xylophilus sp. GOD-11R]|uniref:hypothetical protein n=1 Tax=Xylophilus sp. GOD-11R TaxID=3089814 RepID=UPI00298D2A24|nr:hypothetical protein [Xylophilus sp. GOD-11R]WPB56054.1 hypothetical protein R9X41_18180 [Xylophilus sp. GOD-11R]